MTKHIKRRKKADWVQVVSTILIVIFAISIFVPFWNAVIMSFSTEKAAMRYPFSWLPKEFTLDNYGLLLQQGGVLLKAYAATVYMTFLGTVVGMSICVMAAYGFSRKFPGKKIFFIMILVTMFFGGGLIPTYLQFKNMGLLSIYGCVLVSLVSVYNVIIMKNGFESVPMDLQEAAMIDGAHDVYIFFRIMIPLQKPLIATFTLFTIVGYWNSWYWPMLLLTREKVTTLQLYLRNIVNNIVKIEDSSSMAQFDFENAFNAGTKMAAVFMVMLPVMVIYPFLQKYFTKGIMVGAVKM